MTKPSGAIGVALVARPVYVTIIGRRRAKGRVATHACAPAAIAAPAPPPVSAAVEGLPATCATEAGVFRLTRSLATAIRYDMTTLTVSSREICEMLAGSNDPERVRQKSARLNAWHKAGFFEVLGCGAVNPGVGRGGVLEYPAAARAYAALFDELADGGLPGPEIGTIVSVCLRPHLLAATGALDQAMRGERDLALLWRPVARAGGLGDWLVEANPSIVELPFTLPRDWPAGRWVNLTAVFARARR
jgi:hypothetical protein